MKRLTILAFLFGLFLASLLIAYSGAGDVLDAIADAGWATLAVVLARALAVAVDGFAWRFLFPVAVRPPNWLCVFLRWIREAVNQLLPVAQVGGDLIGARLLTSWGTEGAFAGAGVVADLAVQATTQFPFAGLGLVLLVVLQGDSMLVRYAGGGMVVAAAALAGFFIVQRREGGRFVGGLLRRGGGGRGGVWGGGGR